MRKLSLLMIALLCASLAFAVDNPWDQKLPFKNATINYKISGTKKGTKTIYIKDYGRLSVEISDISLKVFGIGQQTKEKIITTPEWIYTVDLVSKTGIKQTNPLKFYKIEFEQLSKNDKKEVVKNAEKLGVSTVEGLNGKIEKNASKILGYTCDKVSVMGTTAYTISGTGYALKTEGSIMGIKILEEATDIKTSTPPSEAFKIPFDIQFEHNEEADRMMQAQAKSAIQSLLNDEQPSSTPHPSNDQSDDQGKLTPEQKKQMEKMMKMFGNQ